MRFWYFGHIDILKKQKTRKMNLKIATSRRQNTLRMPKFISMRKKKGIFVTFRKMKVIEFFYIMCMNFLLRYSVYTLTY